MEIKTTHDIVKRHCSSWMYKTLAGLLCGKRWVAINDLQKELKEIWDDKFPIDSYTKEFTKEEWDSLISQLNEKE